MYKKNNFVNLWVLNVFVGLLFLTITFVLFNDVMLSPGIITGQDWGHPVTQSQLKKLYEVGKSTWAFNDFFGFIQENAGAATLQQGAECLLSKVGVSEIVFPKLWILCLFTFAGWSMFSLLHFWGLAPLISFVGGLVYITTPIFFNYTIMGWALIFWPMGLFPLATKYFIISVQKNQFKYAVIVAVFYSLAILISQSVIWFLLILLSLGIYLVHTKKDALIFIKMISLILLIYIITNLYVFLPHLIAENEAITGGELIMSAPSRGTAIYLRPLWILRLWGTVANIPFENRVLNSGLITISSFLLPFLMLFALFFAKNKRLIISFTIIALIPFGMYILSQFREGLQFIPFINVFRDFSRFAVLSSFAYPILVAFTLQHFFVEKKYNGFIKFAMFFLLAGIWLLSIKPWLTAEISDWQNGDNWHSSLRTKTFSDDYLDLENYMASLALDQKALYFPIGGLGLKVTDDPRFKTEGTFDVFAALSPLSGLIVHMDKDTSPRAFLDFFKTYVYKDIVLASELTSVRYFIVRKNMVLPPVESVYSYTTNKMGLDLENPIRDIKGLIKYFDTQVFSGHLRKVWDSEKIVVYKKKLFLPHFYVPEKVIFSQAKPPQLPTLLEENRGHSIGIFPIEAQKYNSKMVSNTQIDGESARPIVEYKKLSPTKFILSFHGVRNSFPLIFNEGYHKDWRMYLTKEKTKVSSEQNKVTDGNYAVTSQNQDDQSTLQEVNGFIKDGVISRVGSNRTDFISKLYQSTIQNDNLVDESGFESFWQNSVFDNLHFRVNGYANSWFIDIEDIKKYRQYSDNPDGSIDFSVIVEFSIQKMFDIALAFSVSFYIILGGIITIQRGKKELND
ncbi:MAG: hypothetical protein HOD92_02270 [Deltaproteobacteria bacterium]|jgi:hypothetical protein|nr:hypothetical protein [Deltaproteobacteria bacterium]